MLGVQICTPSGVGSTVSSRSGAFPESSIAWRSAVWCSLYRRASDPGAVSGIHVDRSSPASATANTSR
jgi:hypothetical protein